jgi:hypothetical protein
MSVQPYNARDQPFGLEKIFFDFDSKGDLAKAWKEAKAFAQALTKYYNVHPFLAFSGSKGYHVYVFLESMVTFPTWRLDFVKHIYETLQRKLLKGLQFETLDPAVIGDIKRLARVPFSIHEKTGKQCVPVDMQGNLGCNVSNNLEEYREHGLDTKIIEIVCKELKAQEKWEELRSQRRSKLSKKASGIRPCAQEASLKPLHSGTGHKMRLAIAAEFLNKGFNVD